MGKEKLRIVVLFGGRSGEHEVSLLSAASVIKALDKRKYEVIPVGITREGKWLAGVDPLQMAANSCQGKPVTVLVDPGQNGLTQAGWNQGEFFLGQIDVVFPLLHGTYGEDGTVQGLLELAGLAYVGAGVLSSSLGMDKVLMKIVFAQAGLPQPDFWYCLRKEWEKEPDKVLSEIESRFAYPCFVKPANLGSSVGISKAHNRKELVKALKLAANYDRKIIIEEFISAREIEISVLGNDEPVTSVPGEIIPLKEFYDYEAKYMDNKAELQIPARIEPAIVKVLQDYAVRAFKALDCAGLGRIDFFLDKESGRVLINEINTMPGFTRFSMYPKLWEASGLNYSLLLDKLIELALERNQDKKRTNFKF